MTATLQQTEAQFQRAVLDLARRLGWRCAHFNDSRRQVRPGVFVGDKDAAGFPDLVLVRRGRIVFAELKTEKGRVKPEQREWLDDLRGPRDLGLSEKTLLQASLRGKLPDVLVCLWRPSDWDEVQAVLR